MCFQPLVITAVDGPSSPKVQNGDIASFPNRDVKGHNAPLWFGWLSPDAEIIHRAAEMEVPETRGSDRVAPRLLPIGLRPQFVDLSQVGNLRCSLIADLENSHEMYPSASAFALFS